MSTTILIPSLEPTANFPRLLAELRQLTDDPILIVDDGSGPAYQSVFLELAKIKNTTVLYHQTNLGKGAALKTGFAYHLEHFPHSAGIVTADSDGQHHPADIVALTRLIRPNERVLVLGSRHFTRQQTPFKSYWGNRLTSVIFDGATGISCHDTQTGLRGLPQEIIPDMLGIPGTRFEYEMNVLLNLTKYHIVIHEMPIATIYLDNNSGSHFRVVRDSLRIYQPILSYILSSLSSAGLDIILFTLLIKLFFTNHSWTSLLLATTFARLLSGCFNFFLNRHVVFKSQGKLHQEAGKYLLLFGCQLLLSWLLLQGFSQFSNKLIPLKIAIDFSLFCLSFMIQRRLVFR